MFQIEGEKLVICSEKFWYSNTDNLLKKKF